MQMKKDLMNWKIQVKELSKKASKKKKKKESIKKVTNKRKVKRYGRQK